MSLRDLWAGTKSWLHGNILSGAGHLQPNIDDEGLISQGANPADNEDRQAPSQSSEVVVKAVAPVDKQESFEKLQEGFTKLVDQLGGINEHLTRQAGEHKDLMSRMEQLPQLLENFPAVVENQKLMTEQLFEQLKAAAAKDLQFIDAVEKIPVETAKQTDALVKIDHQLAAAADTDVQMTESLNKFNQTLDKLDQSTLGQTDSIMQMSKTFAASDRYLKYIISRQNKRFMWIFIIAIGVCVVTIATLAAIIIYLRYTK